MKKVLVLGTGFVVKPMVDYFIDECKYKVLVASRDNNNSGQIIAGRPLGKRVLWHAKPPYKELDTMINGVDLVVSMIPPSMHLIVAKACIKNRVNMVTTSYISPELKALNKEVKEAGIIILNEIGEDPGMDHMGAMQMIDMIKSEGGKVKSLTSYGAGIPSFEYNRNPFGYKFSWSPSGVIKAGNTPAVYTRNGTLHKVNGEDIFNHNRVVDIYNLGSFETYPNRDSTRYYKEYDLEVGIDIYRGLLRHPGYCNSMQCLKELGLMNTEVYYEYNNLTYKEFSLSLVNSANKTNNDVKTIIANHLNLRKNSDIMLQFEWLGLFSDKKISIRKGTKADVLIDLMQKKMSYLPHEKDMIIVHNDIIAEFDNRVERRISTMKVEGRPYGHSAMSRAVSLPAAIASKLILHGTIRQKGVCMPTSQEIYKPVLDELADHGYKFESKNFIL